MIYNSEVLASTRHLRRLKTYPFILLAKFNIDRSGKDLFNDNLRFTNDDLLEFRTDRLGKWLLDLTFLDFCAGICATLG